MMELNSLTAVAVWSKSRKQSRSEIHVTLRPRRDRPVPTFSVLSDDRSTFARIVSAITSFIADESLIRIAIRVSSQYRRVVIGQQLHQTIRGVIPESKRTRST